MKISLVFLSFVIATKLFSQELDLNYVTNNAINLNRVADGDENFDGYNALDTLLEGIEIVMLGEQSHQDGTTFETKIKLIKYLHQELGFEVLAFESSLYECAKAWDNIMAGQDIRLNLGKAVNTFWSPLEEFRELTDYLEATLDTDRPLLVQGFDNQLSGGIADGLFVKELREYLERVQPSLVNDELLHRLDADLIKKLWYLEFQKFKKKDAKAIIQYLQQLTQALAKLQTTESTYWVRHLTNTSKFISDIKLGTGHRDEEMAKNLGWLKEKFPGKKIICWGATSHFLYHASEVKLVNSNKSIEAYYQQIKTMGEYLREEYGEKVFTIGFTACEGEYGTIGYGRKLKLEKPKPNSLEHLLAQSEYENFLLAFGPNLSSGLITRPLAYQYIQTDICRLMDAIVFNRKMKRPKADLDLFRKIYPDHKYIK